MKYIDAHCHLSVSDASEIMSAGRDVGVVGAICNSARMSDWAGVVDMCTRIKGIYGAVGVHPWHISDLPNDWLDKLIDILHHNPDLMVGEIGLDKFYPDMSGQLDCFLCQLKAAYNLGRGVHMHCVGAWDKVLYILKNNQNILPRFIIAHCYSGPVVQTKRLADLYNMYFSFSSRNISNVARVLSVPLDRILVESDSADIASVIDSVCKISEILDIAPDKMADIIYKNTLRILRQ